MEKLSKYKPKIAVFNGKQIYEVYSGQKKFLFGRQPNPLFGGKTWVWVMPTSSARCAQLPRAVDKVPFFSALGKFRDYLSGKLPKIEECEITFANVVLTNHPSKNPIKKALENDFCRADESSEFAQKVDEKWAENLAKELAVKAAKNGEEMARDEKVLENASKLSVPKNSPKVLNTPKLSKSTKESKKEKGNLTNGKNRICRSCEGCKREKCGDCAPCKNPKLKQKCKARWCLEQKPLQHN